MKRILYTILGFLFFVFISCTSKIQNSASSSGDTELELVKKYVNALDSFASVMPIIGSDTESDWAADTVHCMANDVLSGNYDLKKTMAKTYHMQNYIAYGMTYFSAIVCTYHEPDLANYALSMVQTSDSLYLAITKDDFKKVNSIIELGYMSLFNLQLFSHLQNSLKKVSGEEPIFNEDSFGTSLQCLDIIETLNTNFTYTDNELKKISAPLENAAFFNTFCPLTQKFASSEEEFRHNQKLILEAALFFDDYANPIYKAYNEGKEVKAMSDEQYNDYFQKAIMYKVAMLRMTTDEIRKMK